MIPTVTQTAQYTTVDSCGHITPLSQPPLYPGAPPQNSMTNNPANWTHLPLSCGNDPLASALPSTPDLFLSLGSSPNRERASPIHPLRAFIKSGILHESQEIANKPRKTIEVMCVRSHRVRMEVVVSTAPLFLES